MADDALEGTELLPHVLRLSSILSECLPFAWEARRYLYSTLFVRAAHKKGVLQLVIDEFDENWKTEAPSLYQLIPKLIDMFGASSDPAWDWVRGYFVDFYQKYNKGTNTASSSPSKSLPTAFKPLASFYYSVHRDIEVFRRKRSERLQASDELYNELKRFAKDNPNSQCPVRRTYVTVHKTADPDIIWAAKEDAFIQIFQRTRELFHFRNEEAHFHHAATIIDFWDRILKKRHKPETRKDTVAFEMHAKDIRTLHRLYVGVLETSQKKMQLQQIFRYVTERMGLSRRFTSIRNAANIHFEKSKKLLGEDTGGELSEELPGLVKQTSSLAATLYGLLHERRKAHDDLTYITEKIATYLKQIDGWEKMTGTEKRQQLQVEETVTTHEEGLEAPTDGPDDPYVTATEEGHAASPFHGNAGPVEDGGFLDEPEENVPGENLDVPPVQENEGHQLDVDSLAELNRFIDEAVETFNNEEAFR